MKFPFACHRCDKFHPMEYQEENKYVYTCECGYKNVHVIGAEKFEILFNFGAHAFLDGYYREAVASFAASLERFYEFYVRTTSAKHCDDTDAFEKAWKLMSSQSERQLGAFAMMYLLETGTVPGFLDSNRLMVNFRNRVIHQGYLPTREETVKYADMAFGLLKDLMKSLAISAPAEYRRATQGLHEQQVKEWADTEGYHLLIFVTDGLLGLGRFTPLALDWERETLSGVDPASPHYPHSMRTDLGFLEAIEARHFFLEHMLYRG